MNDFFLAASLPASLPIDLSWMVSENNCCFVASENLGKRLSWWMATLY